jgi:hypothetical protein
MKSEHVDNRKLYDAVMEKAVLDETEVEHLGNCEECLQFIRVLVQQQLNSAAG